METPIGSPPVLSGSGDAPAGNGGGRARLNAGQWFAREERKAIDAYIQDRELEVVVILEGTDTSTGSTVQVHAHFRRHFVALRVERRIRCDSELVASTASTAGLNDPGVSVGRGTYAMGSPRCNWQRFSQDR